MSELALMTFAACTNNSSAPARCAISKDYISISRSEYVAYIFNQDGIAVHTSSSPYKNKLSWLEIRELDVGKSADLREEDGVQKVKKAEITLSVVPQKTT